jgi:hypothetical protein
MEGKIKMKNLNDAFLDYNDAKRIRNTKYNDMKEKIETIINEIKDSGETVSFSTIYLGSYATKTGVEYNDKDYDIDVGVRLNIVESDLSDNDAEQHKVSVYEAIKKLRKRDFHTMCVSAKYFNDEKPLYHIDFPVYAYDQESDIYYIAKGKRGDVVWEICEPKKLIDFLKFDNQKEEVVEAYRRAIRYLKLWKNKVFSQEPKYSYPPSIAINLTARMVFEKITCSDEIDNLISVSKALLEQISTNVNLKLPFKPYSNVFDKMNSDNKNIEIYTNKLKFLIDSLKDAKNIASSSLEEACKILQKVFPDFPLPDKEDVDESFTPTGSYGK